MLRIAARRCGPYRKSAAAADRNLERAGTSRSASVGGAARQTAVRLDRILRLDRNRDRFTAE